MQKVSASLGLIVAVLEQQPAARAQMLRRVADDTAKVRESVRTCGERRAGLEAQVALSKVWVVCGNVRRGFHRQVEAAAAPCGGTGAFLKIPLYVACWCLFPRPNPRRRLT